MPSRSLKETATPLSAGRSTREGEKPHKRGFFESRDPAAAAKHRVQTLHGRLQNSRHIENAIWQKLFGTCRRCIVVADAAAFIRCTKSTPISTRRPERAQMRGV
jgi:hypothetical protein